MKSTMKKIAASLMALLMMIQLVPALAATYSSGMIVGSAEGYKEALAIVASKGTYVLLGQTLVLDVNEDYEPSWETSNAGAATIDANGVVTAIAEGTATMTATIDRPTRMTASIEVTVIDPDVVIAESEEGEDEEKPEGEDEENPEGEEGEQTKVSADNTLVIVINGENEHVTYDGEEHLLDRYVATANNEELFDETKIKVEGEIGVTGTECGFYELALDGEGITFTYDDEDVTAHFVINNSFLKITPAQVIVTANEASKEEGTPDPELTATVIGLFGEDAIEYTLIREPGEEPGSYAITAEGEEVQGNYRVEYNGSVLTVTEPEEVEKITIIITGETTEVEYDGDVHENTYTVTSSQEGFDETKLHLTEEGKKHLASGTDSGVYNDELTAEDFIYEGEEAEFIINNGSLQINPATVTVQLGTFTKKWGEADPDFTEGMVLDGLLGDDTADMLNLQVVREEGEEAGSYILTLADMEEETGNYLLFVRDGTLVIEMPQVQIRSSMEGVTEAFAGTEVVLTAVMDGLDTERFSIQWQMGDTPDDDSMEDIEGANDSVYTYILDESTAGKYFRVLINLKENLEENLKET